MLRQPILDNTLDQADDFGTIEHFDRHGTLLSEEQRQGIAKARGLCYPCGRKTHEKKRFKQFDPLTNEHVHDGICIKCYQEKVPKEVWAAWKKRHKPSNADASLSSSSGRSSQRMRRSRTRQQHSESSSSDRRRQRRAASERQINDRRKGNVAAAMQRLGSDPLLGDVAAAVKQQPGDTKPVTTRSATASRSSLLSFKKAGSSTRHKTDMDYSERSKSNSQFYDDDTGLLMKAHDSSNSSLSFSQSSRLSYTDDVLGDKSEQSMSDFHASPKSLRSTRSYKGGLITDGNERNMSSNILVEEEEKQSAASNASSKSLNRSRRSLVDDWQTERLGLMSTEIAEILETNIDNAATVRRTLHELRNEYDKEGLRALIQPMKSILTHYKNDPAVLDVACGALWRVAADDVQAKRLIVESGLINLVVDFLAKNQDDYDLAEWALGAVTSTAVVPEFNEYLAQRNVIDAILETLNMHQDKAIVFEWACRCLYTFVTTSYDGEEESAQSLEITSRNLALIEESGGISIIIEAMKVNVSEHAAEVVAIDLLWRFLGATNTTSVSRIVRKYVEAGLFPLLVHLLRLPSTSTELYERVADLLALVLSDNRDSLSSIDNVVESLPSIIRRIREGHQNEIILKASFRIFAAIALLGDLTSSDLEDAGAPTEAIDALKLLPFDSEAVTSGLLVLWKMSSYTPPLFNRDMVVSSMNFIEDAASSDHLSLIDYTASFSFLVNTLETSGLQSFDLPLHLLLTNQFADEANEERARLIALESLPLICSRFPEFGKDAVNYMTADTSCQLIEDGNFDRTYALARVVVAIGSREQLDLPEKVSAAILGLLRDTEDPDTLKVFVHFIINTVASSGANSAFPSSASEILLDLFERNRESLDSCLSILNALAHIVGLSPVSHISEADMKTMLEFALLPSTPRDAKRDASTVVWAWLGRNPTADIEVLSLAYSYSIQVIERCTSESAESFDSSLVEPACGLLCTVARLSPSAPIQISQLEMDAVVAVVYLCMELDESPAIIRFVIEVLYHFSFIYEGLLIQCGVIVVVTDTMQRFIANPDLIESCFIFLAQLASSEDAHINLSILYSDGVESLSCGMKSFPEHLGIQRSGCQAFSHLSVEEETQNLISEQGGAALLIAALNQHGNDQELVEYACSALLNITTNISETVVVELGIIDSVVGLLQKFLRFPSLQQNCLGILQNIAMKGSVGKEAIATSGGLHAVIQCLEYHSDIPVLVERSLTALWSLAVLDENRLRILDSRAISLTVSNMLSLIEYESVQSQACGFLCTIGLEITAKPTLEGAGARNAILFAMRVHYPSVRVQCEAARALSVMFEGSLLPSDDELDAILVAMRRFPLEEELQIRSCAALLSMLLGPSLNFGSHTQEIRGAVSEASRFPSCNIMVAQIKSLVSVQGKHEKASSTDNAAAISLPVSANEPNTAELAECCMCLTECGEDRYKCSGSGRQHSMCRNCAQRYVGSALDQGGFFYHVQYKGGDANAEVSSGLFCIPCPFFFDSCDCAALEYSDIAQILKGSAHLAQKRDIFLQSQTECLGTRPDKEENDSKVSGLPVESGLFNPDLSPEEDACSSSPTLANPSRRDIAPEAVVVVGLWDVGTAKIIRMGSGFVVDRRRGLIMTSYQNVLDDLVDMNSPVKDNRDNLSQRAVMIGVLSGSTGPMSTPGQNTAAFRYLAEVVARTSHFDDNRPGGGQCVLKITSRLQNDMDMQGGDEVCKIEKAVLTNPSTLKNEGLVSLRLTDEVSLEDQVRVWGYSLYSANEMTRGVQVCVDGYICGKAFLGINTDVSDGALKSRYKLVVLCSANADLIGGPCINQHGEVVGMLSCYNGNSNERWCVCPTSSWSHLIRVARDAKTEEFRENQGGINNSLREEHSPNDGNRSNGDESWVLVDEAEERAKRSTQLLRLHQLCRTSADLGTFQDVLKSHPFSIQEKDERGRLPLHTACVYGAAVNIVKLLVEHYEASVKELSNEGMLPIHYACQYEAPSETIQYLQQKWQGSISVKSASGFLPVHFLCLGSCFATIHWFLTEDKTLAKQRTNGGDLPLHLICKNPKSTVGVVGFVLELYPEALSERNNEGLCPVDLAKETDGEILDFLQGGCQQTIPYTRSILHRVCAKSSATLDEVKEALSESSGNHVYSFDDEHMLPLHVACREGASHNVIKCLVDKYPDTLEWTNKGESLPLHTACSNKASLEVIEYLIKAWPEAVQIPNHFGWLPLHCAAAHGASIEVVELLLDYYEQGCEKATYREGDCPLHLACWSGASLGVVDCLIKANKEVVKLANTSGELPLHKACFGGTSLEVIVALVGIFPESPGARDCNGCTPQDAAARWERSEQSHGLVAFLEMQGQSTQMSM